MTRLKYLPFLMSIGIGLSINNTRAVFEALFNKQSEFARTPKYRIEGDADEWVGKKYRQSVAVQPLIELALGLYFTATVFYALANQIYGTRAVPGALPDRLPLHRPAVDRPAVRRRLRAWCAELHPGRQRLMKSKVAVLRVTPDTILSDIDRLVDLAGVSDALAPGQDDDPQGQHLLALPVPGANTTPWQLEGTIHALRAPRLHRSGLRPEQDGRHQRVQGRGPEPLRPDLQALRHPGPLQLQGRGHDVVGYQPKAKMHVLDSIFPEGIQIPDYFHGKNIVHLPTTKCHIYTTTTGAMKNAFGGLLNTQRHYTHSWIHETLVDLLAIQKEIHPGLFAVMDGTTAGNGPGPRTMYPVIKNVMLASAIRSRSTRWRRR